MAFELPAILTRTTAGLPNWAWGLVIIGGVAAGIYFTRSTGAAPAATDTGTGTTGTTGTTDTGTGTTGTTGTTGAPPHGVYVVAKGDTLNKIASKLGVSANHIWQSNRYDICVCIKSHKKPCNFRRGPMPPEIPDEVLCTGMPLDY